MYVENKINLPIEIHSFLYNNKRVIIPDKRILLESDYKNLEPYQEVKFLFDGNGSTSQFSLDSLVVYYSILGLKHIRKTIATTLKTTPADFSKLTPTQQEPNFIEFKFLVIDEKNKQIKFAEKICNIKKDLIIPQ